MASVVLSNRSTVVFERCACSEAANITGIDVAGCLVGSVVAENDLVLRAVACDNAAAVQTYHGMSITTAGGLVGLVRSKNHTAVVLVENNTNAGSVTANGHAGGALGRLLCQHECALDVAGLRVAKQAVISTTLSNGYVGGAVGAVEAEAGLRVRVEGAVVEAQRIETSHSDLGLATNAAGGVVGSVDCSQLGGTTAATAFVSIEDCHVDTLLTTTRGRGTELGGVLGEVSVLGVHADLRVVRCASRGDVNGTEVSGGVVGVVRNRDNSVAAVTVEDCAHTGGVVAGVQSGGVVGAVSSLTGLTLALTRCRSSGGVVVGSSVAGGVVGDLDLGSHVALSLYRCHNSADVRTEGVAGGVVGSMAAFANLTAKLVECNSSGALNSTHTRLSTANEQSAGGVVGSVEADGSNNVVTLRACHNSGRVVASRENAVVSKNAAGVVARALVAGRVLVVGCANTGGVHADSAFECAGVVHSNEAHSGSVAVYDSANHGELSGCDRAWGIAKALNSRPPRQHRPRQHRHRQRVCVCGAAGQHTAAEQPGAGTAVPARAAGRRHSKRDAGAPGPVQRLPVAHRHRQAARRGGAPKHRRRGVDQRAGACCSNTPRGAGAGKQTGSPRGQRRPPQQRATAHAAAVPQAAARQVRARPATALRPLCTRHGHRPRPCPHHRRHPATFFFLLLLCFIAAAVLVLKHRLVAIVACTHSVVKQLTGTGAGAGAVCAGRSAGDCRVVCRVLTTNNKQQQAQQSNSKQAGVAEQVCAVQKR